jgi:nicotinamidase-related amidase
MASSNGTNLQTLRALLGIKDNKPTLADSVLVIIDAQNEYATGLLKVARINETRAAIKALLDRYRSSGGSVIHVAAQLPEGAPVFTPNTPLASILDELAPVEGEPVVHKAHASAYTGTDFQKHLDATKKTKIAVVGKWEHRGEPNPHR